MARETAPTKILSRRILVIVKREQTTSTPRVIWQHEKPLLEAVFGEGNIEEIDAAKLDEGYSNRPSAEMLVHNKKMDTPTPPSQAQALGYVFIGDPRGEYERLIMAYGKHAEVNQTVVEYVYGRFQEGRFSAVVGNARLHDLPAEQLRQLILAFGYPLPDAGKDTPTAERSTIAKERAAFFSLDQAALVKLAEETGVIIGG